MATTIQNIISAFNILYSDCLNDHETNKFYTENKTELLPLVRYHLLGYFGCLESKAQIKITRDKKGWLDFIINDDVAVEFVVKNTNYNRSILNKNTNSDDVKKLMRYEGKSLLILFDLSPNTANETVIKKLEEYADRPSLGQGNHNKYPFNVVYFYQNEDEITYKHINVDKNGTIKWLSFDD